MRVLAYLARWCYGVVMDAQHLFNGGAGFPVGSAVSSRLSLMGAGCLVVCVAGSENGVVMSYAEELRVQREYAALCDEARKLGVPTSLDDPRSPRTVEGLRAAVEVAKGGGRS